MTLVDDTLQARKAEFNVGYIAVTPVLGWRVSKPGKDRHVVLPVKELQISP